MYTKRALNQLFSRLGELVERDQALDHHFALHTLFEMMDVASRADMKSDVLKDLDKQKQVLNGYRGNPAISEAALDKIVNQLDQCFTDLNALAGKSGQSLTENDWLMSIRSRVGIPGGTCEFDLPSYYAWQHESVAKRQADIQQWASSLAPLYKALEVMLGLLRDAGHPHMVAAPGGQFQQSPKEGRQYQLLRLRIDPALGLIPEISGNRLMISIRLMRQDMDARLKLASDIDAGFELTLCA